MSRIDFRILNTIACCFNVAGKCWELPLLYLLRGLVLVSKSKYRVKLGRKLHILFLFIWPLLSWFHILFSSIWFKNNISIPSFSHWENLFRFKRFILKSFIMIIRGARLRNQPTTCRGGSRGGGAPGAHPPPPLKLEKIWFFGVKSWFFTRNTQKTFAPPSAIGKNMICWHKIVIFHTKYPKYFRASLRSAQFF
jgi:hypothetical protein